MAKISMQMIKSLILITNIGITQINTKNLIHRMLDHTCKHERSAQNCNICSCVHICNYDLFRSENSRRLFITIKNCLMF